MAVAMIKDMVQKSPVSAVIVNKVDGKIDAKAVNEKVTDLGEAKKLEDQIYQANQPVAHKHEFVKL